MNYKLAKQLKDAGFPFKKVEYATDYDEDGIGNCCYCESKTFGSGSNAYLIPTLEELIEACGDIEFELTGGFGDGWWACNGDGSDKDRHGFILCNAKTPTEAVAKLWLKINK